MWLSYHIMPNTVLFDSYWVLLPIVLLVIGYLAVEAHRHRRHLRRIPIRIHVNGTRGKSSITRLIAAGLRAGGIKTCAKTTGTIPRFIRPDGSEEPIYRASRPHILEQIDIFSTAMAYHPEAIVIECMALQPLLQAISELKLVRATHTVISNIREDHLDVMGPEVADVALAFAGTTPVKGRLYTTEHRYLSTLRDATRDRQSDLIVVDTATVSQINGSILSRFNYAEHAENIALALRVCEDLGVARDTALHGMWQAQPDPGAMTLYEIDWGKHRLIFVNGFAANDPLSTELLWHQQIQRFPECKRRIALVNCRADRRQRSQQLAIACAKWEPADLYIIIGTGTQAFIRHAIAQGISRIKLIDAHDWQAKDIFTNLVASDNDSPALSDNPLPSLVMGMGNIAGIGFEVVEYFKRRAMQNRKEI